MRAFILFTRIPKENYTKTRLMTHLTGKQCEQLHFAFLNDLYVTLKRLEDVKVFICYAPEDKENFFRMNIPLTFYPFEQVGNSLGERMENAFLYVQNKGFSEVVLTGADVPHLKQKTVVTSFEKLQNADVVLGGTEDGGYYLIGMKNVYSSLFYLSTTWGSSSVYEETINLVKNKALTIAELERMIDIDTWEDIQSLNFGQLHCEYTKAYLYKMEREND